MCAECSITRPFGDPSVLAKPEAAQLLQEITLRIAAPNPIRICDDPKEWDWRAYLAQRRLNNE